MPEAITPTSGASHRTAARLKQHLFMVVSALGDGDRQTRVVGGPGLGERSARKPGSGRGVLFRRGIERLAPGEASGRGESGLWRQVSRSETAGGTKKPTTGRASGVSGLSLRLSDSRRAQ